MKKKYVIAAGLLVLSLMAAGCGCGKKDKEKTEQPQTTVAPAKDDSTASGDLVDIQVSTEKKEEKVIGTKTDTASRLTIINKTGSEVAAIYVRPHPDDDDDEDWGEELIQEKFVLANRDEAVYYFEKGSSSLYDIRITYSEEGKNECFFRKIPLNNISQISLCMDGVGEDSIPYARYLSGNSTKEISTLTEVKQRLGIYDDDSDDDDSDDDSDYDQDEEETQATPTPTAAPAATATPAPTATPADPDDSYYSGANDPDISAAEGSIGQSLDTLIGLVGEPQQSDYENEPETGETGYHYYENFTVSTTVDENGNEIVAGIW